jgi:hypothetical protein
MNNVNHDCSIFLDHVPKSKSVIVVNRRNCCNEFAFFKFLVFECNPPVGFVTIIT